MSVRLESPPRPAGVGMTTRASSAWAALAGVVSVAAFLASAEAVAWVTGAGGSPLFGVGSAAIDLAPAAVKNLMVSLFGTGDKVALFVLMGVLLVAITAGAGVLEHRRPPGGKIVFGIGGVVALVAVLTRADSTSLDGAPTAVGTVVSLVVLSALMTRLHRWEASTEPGWAAATVPEPPLRGPGLERRGFLVMAIAVGAASVVVGTGARLVNATRANVGALRDALTLPAPAQAAPAVPAGASLDVEGITPYVTPNADFYRIDTALQVPSIDPADWSLRIHGLVDREIEISFDELLALPLEEHYATLSCVSNEVGGDLIGTALGSATRSAPCSSGPGRRAAPTWCSRPAATGSPRARRCPCWSTTRPTRSSPWG